MPADRDWTRAVTSREVEAFWRDGVVCLRGILPTRWLERMDEPVDRARRSDASADLTKLAEDLAGDRSASRMTGATLDEPQGRFFAGVDHWRTDEAFRAFACASPLPGIAAALLRSESVWLYEDSVLVKEPGAAEETLFHQDAGYFNVEGEQVCTFWVPLDPTSTETGTLEFARGSHRWDRRFRPTLFVADMALPGSLGEEMPDIRRHPERYDLLSFDLEPGDLTVHHYRTVHGAPANRSASTRRRAVSVRYCGDDARYHLRPGAPRKIHHREVEEGEALGGPDCPQVWPPRAPG